MSTDVRPVDPANALYGVYVGIVSDIEDPEDMARVKLTFPWRDSDDESCWARIAPSMTGADMGTYYLPEVGDEVLVAFGNGDMHDPYVVGSLWNGNQKPPQKNKPDNPIRQIKSRAGHVLTFDDTDDIGAIEIETNKGQKIVVDDDAEEITIEDINGNTVVLDSDGISLSSDGTISLDGASIELSADQSVDISGNTIKANAKSSAEVASKGQLSLSATGSATLEATGMLKAKSSAVVQIDGSMIMLN